MSAEITPIGPRPHVERYAPDEAVIAELEKLMALAKEGRLRSIGVAGVLADELNESGRATFTFVMGSNTVFCFSHALRMLVLRWEKFCDQASSQP